MSLFFLEQQKPAEKVDCLAVSIGDTNLLAPMSAVAEMIHNQPPQKAEPAPEWMLGWIDWRELKVPLIDFSAIQQREISRETDENTKILVLHSFAEAHEHRYYAMVTSGFPRALRVQEDSELNVLQHTESDDCVAMKVDFEQQSYVIPDFEKLETYLQQLPKPALASNLEV